MDGPDPHVAPAGGLHIVSWNVASWETSMKCIRSSFKTLEMYLGRHNIDILLLQEVKGTKKKLVASPVEFGTSTIGYDFFVALCEGGAKGTQGAGVGFNGVAAYVRKGLTLKADAHPLKHLDADLDKEGRAIVIRLADFSILNVYTPNNGGGVRLPTQLRFLRLCETVMQKERTETGKPVIMAGDFNLTYRGVDRHYLDRCINLTEALGFDPRHSCSKTAGHGACANDATQLGMKIMNQQLRANWPAILTMLRGASIVEKTTVGKDRKSRTRWKIKAQGQGRRVELGKVRDNPAHYRLQRYECVAICGVQSPLSSL
jgi:exonuclease III